MDDRYSDRLHLEYVDSQGLERRTQMYMLNLSIYHSPDSTQVDLFLNYLSSSEESHETNKPGKNYWKGLLESLITPLFLLKCHRFTRD